MKEKRGEKEKSDSKPRPKSPQALLVLLLICLAVVLGFAGIWYFLSRGNSLSSTSTKSTPEPARLADDAAKRAAESQASATGTSAVETEFNGWEKYSNFDVGYQLWHPASWSLKETNENNTRYVTLTDKDGNYSLQFGTRKKGEGFSLGESASPAGTKWEEGPALLIFDTRLKSTRAVGQGKAREYRYPSAMASSADGRFEFWAKVAATDKVSPNEIDLDNNDFRPIAEKVLKSVESI